MSDEHLLVLSLGSNIDAEVNLSKAMSMLRGGGEVKEVSSVWESESVGFDGPNFLNACVLFPTSFAPAEFKEKVVRPIEAKLNRLRSSEKNAPRTIDIDIVLDDVAPLNTEFWEYAFVIVPLAELLPDFKHPVSGEKLSVVAEQLKRQVWMRKREDVVISLEVPRHG